MKELSRSLLLAEAGGGAEAVKEGKDQRGKTRRMPRPFPTLAPRLRRHPPGSEKKRTHTLQEAAECILFSSAGEGSRTHTPKAPDPKSGLSTNFNTPA